MRGLTFNFAFFSFLLSRGLDEEFVCRWDCEISTQLRPEIMKIRAMARLPPSIQITLSNATHAIEAEQKQLFKLKDLTFGERQTWTFRYFCSAFGLSDG